jgi:molybdate transport system ATP-binding protein
MSLDSFLTSEMQLRAGALSIHAQFALSEPWTVLFGPSGSGKTTVLRTIAGFVRPDAGRIVLGEKVLVDCASGVFVPPYERPVRTAGQTARLFPHRTVRWNTMYGSGWASKHANAMEIAQETMKLFRLTDLADRMPRDLSGGERQRASVARAVVSAVTYDGPGKPLLLLDEPFSGLDNAMRNELLVELQGWLRRWAIPVLSVTHSVGEAFQLGARVIKVAEGRIVQQGPVGVVLADERNRLMEQLGVEQVNRVS